MALEYFELTLLDSEEVTGWMDDWSTFVQNLCTQFGPIDPTTDTEDGINNLMQDNQHIVKYNVEFNCLQSALVGTMASFDTATTPD